MPRGRKPANQSGSSVSADPSADIFDDVEGLSERLSAGDVESLTGGFGPASRGARSGELSFADFDE